MDSLKSELKKHRVRFDGIRFRVENEVLHVGGNCRGIDNAGALNLCVHEAFERVKFDADFLVVPTRSDKVKRSKENGAPEIESDEKLIKRQARVLAKLLRQANYSVVYTGAGISTAADIPDFRGPEGVWSRQDRGEEMPDCPVDSQLARWLENGLIKFITSQNVDGLHRKSGVPAGKLAELHGNCFKEYCAECKKEYLRDFDCCDVQGKYNAGGPDALSQSGISHLSGRKCTCGQPLRDSVIHFGEDLPDDHFARAEEESKKADLVLGRMSRVCDWESVPVSCAS
ncbi:MAG: hypothetical protein MHM6MM_002785 [Cercozoa sp. M6MM]